MSDYKSLVERKLDPVGESGNDTIYRCPSCEGSVGSGHLYVDYNKGYYHCFKCDFAGRDIRNLLRYLNIDISYDYDRLSRETDDALKEVLSLKAKKSIADDVRDYSTDLVVLTEYYLYHSQPLSPQAHQYLRNRGLSDETISTLRLSEGINRYGDIITIKGVNHIGRDYSGRILIPSRQSGDLISFYVCRDYIGDKSPKYLNPPKELAVASEDVWNLGSVQSDSVIICEGVFTAISASPIKLNAVATYGKSISKRSSNLDVKVSSQGEKLLAKKFKNYYVAYDADALDEALKSCDYLYSRGANVYLIVIDPKKYGSKADVNDIGYNEFLKLLSSSIHYTGGISHLTL